MKDAASTAQREQNQRQGLIVGTITLPFRLLGVLIGSLLFSIVIECVGMHLFWQDQGWRHSQQMLQYELGHLSNHFTRSVVVQEPGRTAHELVDTGYEWVFVRSGLLERMSQTAERVPAPSHGQTPQLPLLHQPGLCLDRELPDRAAFTTLTFLGAPAGPGAHAAADPHGGIRRLDRRPGATGCAPVRRGPGIRLHLPPGEGQSDAARRAAVGDLPGSADLGASAADPAAERRVAGTGSKPDGGQLQEVPLGHQSGRVRVPIVCGLKQP